MCVYLSSTADTKNTSLLTSKYMLRNPQYLKAKSGVIGPKLAMSVIQGAGPIVLSVV